MYSIRRKKNKGWGLGEKGVVEGMMVGETGEVWFILLQVISNLKVKIPSVCEEISST